MVSGRLSTIQSTPLGRERKEERERERGVLHQINFHHLNDSNPAATTTGHNINGTSWGFQQSPGLLLTSVFLFFFHEAQMEKCERGQETAE